MGGAIRRLNVFLVALMLAAGNSAGAQISGDGQTPGRRDLPPEITIPDNASVSMDLSDSLLETGMQADGNTIKLEATYNESISLKEVLEHVLRYNLPIRISRESWHYQRGQFFAAMAGFLPTYYSSYKATNVRVFPNTRAPSQVFISEVRYPVFLGGAVLYGTLGQHYRNRAWKNSFQNTIDASLLDAYNKYSDLVLQHMMLKIRKKSVALAQASLEVNEANYKAGIATQFDVLQTRSHLAETKDELYQQQLATRTAAMALCNVIDAPLLINFLPRETLLKQELILDKRFGIADYERLALEKRHELRQYEQFRLAASRSIQSAASSLYPTVSLFTAYTVATTELNNPQNVGLLNGVAATEVAQAEENNGVVTNTALDQTASFSPGSANTAVGGANTLTDVVAGSGGNPIANVQSGSLVTSGAVKPNFGASAVTGAPSTSNIQGSNTASAGIFPGHSQNFQMGMNLGWNLFNLGLSSTGNVLAARALSRQSSLQANQQLLLVMKQVHASYFSLQNARKRVKATATAVDYGRQSLSLARLRTKAGLGNNLELIEAHNDYIGALLKQAEAISAVNRAQAQLLKDTGVISVATLTGGYR